VPLGHWQQRVHRRRPAHGHARGASSNAAYKSGIAAYKSNISYKSNLGQLNDAEFGAVGGRVPELNIGHRTAGPNVAEFAEFAAAEPGTIRAAFRAGQRPFATGRAGRGHQCWSRLGSPAPGQGAVDGSRETGPGLGQQASPGGGRVGQAAVGPRRATARRDVGIGGARTAFRWSPESAERGGSPMTSATTQTGLTVRTFLLGSGPEDDTAKIRQLLSEHDVVSKCGGDLARLTQQGREAAEEQLASITAELLDLDLGDLLIYEWRMGERLAEAARQTRLTPRRRELVQLGSHRITLAGNPTVELLVDGVRVHTFRFQLTVIFDIEVADLIVQNGLLTALKAGDGVVNGTLTLEMPGGDVELVNQQQKINLHLIINIGHGIPLLPAENRARPARTALGPPRQRPGG
jgi:hypothetical protein